MQSPPLESWLAQREFEEPFNANENPTHEKNIRQQTVGRGDEPGVETAASKLGDNNVPASAMFLRVVVRQI